MKIVLLFLAASACLQLVAADEAQPPTEKVAEQATTELVKEEIVTKAAEINNATAAPAAPLPEKLASKEEQQEALRNSFKEITELLQQPASETIDGEVRLTKILTEAGPPMMVLTTGTFDSAFAEDADENEQIAQRILRKYVGVDKQLLKHHLISEAAEDFKQFAAKDPLAKAHHQCGAQINTIFTQWVDQLNAQMEYTDVAESENATLARENGGGLQPLARQVLLDQLSGQNLTCVLDLWKTLVSGLHLQDPEDHEEQGQKYDLLQAYLRHAECNPKRVQAFCAINVGIINKGLLLQGASQALEETVEKLDAIGDSWAEHLNVLEEHCLERTSTCAAQWNARAHRIVSRELAKFKEQGGDHNSDGAREQLTQTIYQHLVDAIPQRRWVVWTFNRNEHAQYLYRNTLPDATLMEFNGVPGDVDAVVVSFSEDSRAKAQQLVQTIGPELQKAAGEVSHCPDKKKYLFGLIKKQPKLKKEDVMDRLEHLHALPEMSKHFYFVMEDSQKPHFVAEPKESLRIQLPGSKCLHGVRYYAIA